MGDSVRRIRGVIRNKAEVPVSIANAVLAGVSRFLEKRKKGCIVQSAEKKTLRGQSFAKVRHATGGSGGT